jgi:FkbM family methyltransferase
MNIKKSLKNALERNTGWNLYKKIPFGLDPYLDLKSKFKEYKFKTFFDVGANVGQSVKAMRKQFPKVEIYCFEPVKKTFELLKANTMQLQVNYYQIAFGSKPDEIEILVNSSDDWSEMNSILSPGAAGDSLLLIKEKIKVSTLSEFCSDQSISKIDYLKIDTEGYDLEVLKGGTDLLKKQSVSFIEIELGMNPENHYHVDFVEVKSFLENFDYRIYGIYEQVQEWPTNTPILRRVNTLFVSRDLYGI